MNRVSMTSEEISMTIRIGEFFLEDLMIPEKTDLVDYE